MIRVLIQERAKAKGITTAYQLQKLLDVQPSVAARLWKGDFTKIDLGTLSKLCEKLKCQPSQLLKYVADNDNEQGTKE